MNNRYNIAAEQREEREDALLDRLKTDMDVASVYLYNDISGAHSTGMAEKEIKRLTGLDFDIANFMLEAKHEHCGDMIRNEMNYTNSEELMGDIIEHVFDTYGAEIIAYHEKLAERQL